MSDVNEEDWDTLSEVLQRSIPDDWDISEDTNMDGDLILRVTSIRGTHFTITVRNLSEQ